MESVLCDEDFPNTALLLNSALGTHSDFKSSLGRLRADTARLLATLASGEPAHPNGEIFVSSQSDALRDRAGELTRANAAIRQQCAALEDEAQRRLVEQDLAQRDMVWETVRMIASVDHSHGALRRTYW
jgi:hypothetical protein